MGAAFQQGIPVQLLRSRAMKSVLLFLVPAALMAQSSPDFVQDVAPIFANKCIGCHAAKVKMGALDLDTVDGLKQGGHKGTILVPGNSKESRLYRMVAGLEAPAMPMGGAKLTDAELAAIKNWIDSGANLPGPEFVSVTELSNAPGGGPVFEANPGAKAQIFSMAFRPDGKLLAVGGYKEVRLVDSATGRITATLTGMKHAVRAVAFSGDGALLAAAGGNPGVKGEAVLWDTATNARLASMEGHDDCIYGLAISPDGKTLATSSYDKLIKLWDTASGKEIRTLKDHIDAVYALAFTPDGSRLISASADRAVKVWDPATGQRLYSMSEPLDGLNAVAVSPSGKLVAAGGLDKTIRTWSLGGKNATMVDSLIAHEDAILSIAFSPDGETLVSSAADGAIKVFQTRGLTELKTIPGQSDWVMALEYSADGSVLAAGRHDGTLSIYDAKSFTDKLEPRRAAR
jgi:WD40 repeat protein/mono/diheme cytochrome c family protein